MTLIEQANGLGLSLAIDGDKLTVTGPKTPAALALLQQLAQHKPAVIAYLTQPASVATAADLAFTQADVDTLPIEPVPPMRVVDARPPLPAALWLSGLTAASALAAHRRLQQQYFCTCGADGAGWFVRCDPKHYEVSDGMNKAYLPQPATEPAHDAATADLTLFVGLDVSDGDMAILTSRALAYGWSLEARRVPAGWHIGRLTAKAAL